MTNTLGIITARGGSKGLPRKNLAPLGGHPLIAWTIASALASKSITRLIVSTENEEIADVARSYGAEVPFMRPAELAQDDTPDAPVLRHAIMNSNCQSSAIVHLRPTSPLRPHGLIDLACQACPEWNVHLVRTMTPSKQIPYKTWKPDLHGRAVPFTDWEDTNTPRQNLLDTYWQTGHADVWRVESLIGDSIDLYVRPLLVDAPYCIDIDTESDLREAERRLDSLDLDRPGERRREFPEHVSLLACDFDGVFTNNEVTIDHEGHEHVSCSRADGLGIRMLKDSGVPVIVVSSETNPVATYRCSKMGVECFIGTSDKPAVIRRWLEMNGAPNSVVYVGNDLNDVPAMRCAAYAICPADAHPEVKAVADCVLQANGGRGAVREVCEMILSMRAHHANC